MMPGDDQLEAEAKALKTALDAIDRYPRGACGHCAELLAYHLHRRFGIVPDYVSGIFFRGVAEKETGHAWIEWNGLTIDISGDQFGWPPVIAARGSIYHASGEIDLRYPWKLDAAWWEEQCGEIWKAAEPSLSPEANTSPARRLDLLQARPQSL
jgi:hypothetical protein